ncbi:MAG: hypothetical protein ACRDWI_14550 [Jiangellaceae bacterium]
MPELWERATRHPFLVGMRDGTLPRAAFDTWLAQDHRFVGYLLWFQARLLARAPRPAQHVLGTVAAALVDELGWFEELATGGARPGHPAASGGPRLSAAAGAARRRRARRRDDRAVGAPDDLPRGLPAFQLGLYWSFGAWRAAGRTSLPPSLRHGHRPG